MDKPKIFVSYSHRDPKALQELERFLKPLGREGLIVNWTDNQIKPGEDWHAKIDEALDTATVAVLLVSQDFLNMPIRLAQATPTGSGTVLLPPTSATERVSTGEFGWTHAPAPLLATR